MLYLLYPKTKDFQKALLIPLGYALYTFWMANVSDFQGALLALKSNWKSLFWAMLIFDFLFYQARFQINDICGLKKDMEGENPPIAGMKGAGGEIIGKMLIVSFLVAVVRIIVGIALMIVLPLYNKAWMRACVLVLAGVTFLYEKMRAEDDEKKENQVTFWICFLVGFGYPLRFLAGVLAAGTFEWDVHIAAMLGAWYCYGLVMVIVAWMMQIQKLVDPATREMPSSAKLHFKCMKVHEKGVRIAVYVMMAIPLACAVLAVLRNQDIVSSAWSIKGTFYTIPLIMMFASYIGVLVLLFSKPGSLLDWMRKRELTYNVASFFMGADCAKDYFGNSEQKKETTDTKNS